MFEYVKEGKFFSFFSNEENERRRELLEFCIELAEGIENLHLQKVIHCDLKPQNIWVRVIDEKESGRKRLSPLIMDLGKFGKWEGDKEADMKKSRAWMPQEYLFENLSTEKTDVWSLGCLMFYILTGGVQPWSRVQVEDIITVKMYQKENFFENVKDY